MKAAGTSKKQGLSKPVLEEKYKLDSDVVNAQTALAIAQAAKEAAAAARTAAADARTAATAARKAAQQENKKNPSLENQQAFDNAVDAEKKAKDAEKKAKDAVKSANTGFSTANKNLNLEKKDFKTRETTRLNGIVNDAKTEATLAKKTATDAKAAAKQAMTDHGIKEQNADAALASAQTAKNEATDKYNGVKNVVDKIAERDAAEQASIDAKANLDTTNKTIMREDL